MSTQSALTGGILFGSLILAVTSALQPLTKHTRVPYTVALLILGFSLQLISKELNIDIGIGLPTEVTYSLILPLMLFESAFHINFHQFKMQFKTITFMATFGVLLAIGIIGGLLSLLIGLSLPHALLFGAIIASTDPISVVALFKELGAPKRLGLVAEGESMFNDATAVIFFRLLAGFAVAQQHFSTVSLVRSVGDFVYVFAGSLLAGAVMGYVAALFIARVKNDRLVETTLTVALALFSFIAAEHFFKLSGVISTVAAGIVMGNIGRTKISSTVVSFMEEFWEYLAFLGVSLVFFFAAFELDITFISLNPRVLATVVAVTLVARAISVYVSFAITNYAPGFKNEPNVPLSWQHVMNWGGLRGVIPLVLVYSLPEDYFLRETFISYTLACFIFTLLVNATTIRQLMMALKLHLPRREEEIVTEQSELFKIGKARRRLEQLSKDQFPVHILQDVERQISRSEREHQRHLLDLVTPKELTRSLRLEGLEIERILAQKMYSEGSINEVTLYEFISELDLQQDALEHPQIVSGKGFRSGGKLASQELFQAHLERIREGMRQFVWMQSWLMSSKERLIMERLALLQTRIVGSTEVLKYLDGVSQLLAGHTSLHAAIQEVQHEHEQHRLKNSFQMQSLERDYPRFYQNFERQLVEALTWVDSPAELG